MKAVKGNRVYTITEADVKRFVADGYDVKDDAGNIVAFGAGKTVPFGRYAEALKRIEDLTAENVELRKKVMKAKEAPAEVPVEEEAPAEAPEEEPKTKSKTKSKKK